MEVLGPTPSSSSLSPTTHYSYNLHTLHHPTLRQIQKMVSARVIKLTLAPILLLSLLASIVSLAISASLESESPSPTLLSPSSQRRQRGEIFIQPVDEKQWRTDQSLSYPSFTPSGHWRKTSFPNISYRDRERILLAASIWTVVISSESKSKLYSSLEIRGAEPVLSVRYSLGIGRCTLLCGICSVRYPFRDHRVRDFFRKFSPTVDNLFRGVATFAIDASFNPHHAIRRTDPDHSSPLRRFSTLSEPHPSRL